MSYKRNIRTSSTPAKRCFMSVRSRHSHRESHFYFFFSLPHIHSTFFLRLTSFPWSSMKGRWNIEWRKNLILNESQKISYFYVALTFNDTQSFFLCLFSACFLFFLFRFKHIRFYCEMEMVGEILKRTLMWYIAIHVSLHVGRINLLPHSHIYLLVLFSPRTKINSALFFRALVARKLQQNPNNFCQFYLRFFPLNLLPFHRKCFVSNWKFSIFKILTFFKFRNKS